ncbi:uncharacterized protein LOC105702612 [Orussus abietinus]|uniref:uncharacterized protein LOC105702612 n=1 Tax=Orussus abietinus TaxID=222816 RepID=UPI000C715F5F|nr:uncharacterized protein LOC105702612 [Orussus abietinus]
MAPGRILLVLVLIAEVGRTLPSSSHSVTRNVFGVSLPEGHMEIVKEERCSDAIIRLTCRSLRAIIFVLEAELRTNRSETCGYDLKKIQSFGERWAKVNRKAILRKTFRNLRGNYILEDEEEPTRIDLRTSLNRRCSGLQHCRYNIMTDHPAASYWNPANVHLKYACIPEGAIRRYCNVMVQILRREEGYIRSPGYPLYYLGGTSCGWTFKTLPGQRISLTFHDLNIRSPEPDGRCVDVVRIRENGTTLFESCETFAGVQVNSKSNLITLDLIASAKLYPARGFFLHYQVLGCPEVAPPNGSDVTEAKDGSRTFSCRVGAIFPDTRQRSRTVTCKDGQWNETVGNFPGCMVGSNLT